jgi:hypothetical protein
MQRCFVCTRLLRTTNSLLSQFMFWLDAGNVVAYPEILTDTIVLLRIHLCSEDFLTYSRTPEVIKTLAITKIKRVYKEKYGEDLS